MEDRRFIEETFPVKEVSEESVREKGIRQGHISTIHVWWARRPLASSRATSFAALVPAPSSQEELGKLRKFVVDLSKWENSLDRTILERARQAILQAASGKAPRVLDPFAGGGAIPLEALRLGCETYASDYNPVATLMLKCLLEYPQRYLTSIPKSQNGLRSDEKSNRLLETVNKWSNWLFEEVKRETGQFYPTKENGSIPIGYIWARTIRCQNPSCNAEIPLMRQFWLARKTNMRVSLYPYVSDGKVEFKIVGDGYERIPKDFDPAKGTVSKAVGKCLVCGSIVDGKTTRKLFLNGESNQRMIVVVLHKTGSSGKKFRIATDEDVHDFARAERYLNDRRKSLQTQWGYDPVPDEPTPAGRGRGAERAFSVRNYNMNTWGDLFNSRQKLSLIVFAEKLRSVRPRMEGEDEEYIRAVMSYLALGFDKLVSASSVLSKWKPTSVQETPALGGGGRQALPMTWDYFELNPLSGISMSWPKTIDVMLGSFRILKETGAPAKVRQCTATALPYPDDYFDAVFTDPPYYDNVPYSYLSDFFYVWLKRTIGDLYPDLFSTPLTPKSQEIVAYSNIEGGWEAGKQFFETALKKSFSEINRVLRPSGIATIVYAHKSTAGWETLVNSLLDSGLVVTGAWPIRTEMRERLRAKESAALGSSIYMIARKFPRLSTGFYNEVKYELKQHLNEKLDRIWGEGISGADFFISAIGSAIEVFGKYEKIIDDEGNEVRADRLLEDVRRIVTDYAVKQVLHNGFAAEIKPLTRFYVLWRWAYGEAVMEFDDARKLGQSVGIDVSQEWNRGFISKEKEFIEVLGPEDRALESLESSTELIDVLHRVLLLWKKGRYDEVTKVLRDTGFGKSDVFYRVAQAISESLTNGDKEKKLLEGFLSGKERIVKEVKNETGQTRLFE
jgi:adenine-specific DNA methylase